MDWNFVEFNSPIIANSLAADLQNLDKHKGIVGKNIVFGNTYSSNPQELVQPIFLKHNYAANVFLLNIQREPLPNWVESISLDWNGYILPLPPPFSTWVFNLPNPQLPYIPDTLFSFNLDIELPDFDLINLNDYFQLPSLPNIDINLDWKLFLPKQIQLNLKSLELFFEEKFNELMNLLNSLVQGFESAIQAVVEFIKKAIQINISFNLPELNIDLKGLIDLINYVFGLPRQVFDSFFDWLKASIPSFSLDLNFDFKPFLEQWRIDINLDSFFNNIASKVQEVIDNLNKFIKFILACIGNSLQELDKLIIGFKKLLENAASIFTNWLISLFPQINITIPGFNFDLPKFSLPPWTLPPLAGLVPFPAGNIINWENWLKANIAATVPTWLPTPIADPTVGAPLTTAISLASLPPGIKNLISTYSFPGMIYFGLLKIKPKAGIDPGVYSTHLYIKGDEAIPAGGISTLGRITATCTVLEDNHFSSKDPQDVVRKTIDVEHYIVWNPEVTQYEFKSGFPPDITPTSNSIKKFEFLNNVTEVKTFHRSINSNDFDDEQVIGYKDTTSTKQNSENTYNSTDYTVEVSQTKTNQNGNIEKTIFSNLHDFKSELVYTNESNDINKKIPISNLLPLIGLPSGVELPIKVPNFEIKLNLKNKKYKLKISWLTDQGPSTLLRKRPDHGSDYTVKVYYKLMKDITSEEKSLIQVLQPTSSGNYILDVSNFPQSLKDKITSQRQSESEPYPTIKITYTAYIGTI